MLLMVDLKNKLSFTNSFTVALKISFFLSGGGGFRSPEGGGFRGRGGGRGTPRGRGGGRGFGGGRGGRGFGGGRKVLIEPHRHEGFYSFFFHISI